MHKFKISPFGRTCPDLSRLKNERWDRVLGASGMTAEISDEDVVDNGRRLIIHRIPQNSFVILSKAKNQKGESAIYFTPQHREFNRF